MSEYITINTTDGSFSACLARPKATLAPAIVVIQEILGVNADLRATAISTILLSSANQTRVEYIEF